MAASSYEFESFCFATVLYRRCHNDAIYAALLAGGGFVDLLFGRMRFDGGSMKTDVIKKIKVCFIVPRAYPLFNPDKGDYFGGAEFDLYCLATELARDSSFEVSFIVADYGQNDVETIEGVTILKSHDFNKNVFDGALQTWRAMKRADADIYFLSAHRPACRWWRCSANCIAGVSCIALPICLKAMGLMSGSIQLWADCLTGRCDVQMRFLARM